MQLHQRSDCSFSGYDLISHLVAALFFVDTVDSGAIIGQVEPFTYFGRNVANDPMLDMLRDWLCRQIALNEDFEDIPAILLLEEVVHTGFKFRE